MRSLAHRLRLVRLTIGDQADYLQHLLDQFDMPYDASCTLQVMVDDLHSTAGRLDHLAVALPRKRRQRTGKTPRRGNT